MGKAFSVKTYLKRVCVQIFLKMLHSKVECDFYVTSTWMSVHFMNHNLFKDHFPRSDITVVCRAMEFGQSQFSYYMP